MTEGIFSHIYIYCRKCYMFRLLPKPSTGTSQTIYWRKSTYTQHM